jgi:hypothetical protein
VCMSMVRSAAAGCVVYVQQACCSWNSPTPQSSVIVTRVQQAQARLLNRCGKGAHRQPQCGDCMEACMARQYVALGLRIMTAMPPCAEAHCTAHYQAALFFKGLKTPPC